MVLLANLVGCGTWAHLKGWLEERAQVKILGLESAKAFVHFEQIGATDHLVDGAHSQFRHDAPKLFSQVVEEVDDVLWLPGEFGTELRVLSCNAYCTGVEVATPEHDATQSDQRTV